MPLSTGYISTASAYSKKAAVSKLSKNEHNILMMLVALFALFVGLYHLGDARISHDELKTLRLVKDHAAFEVLTNFYSFSHVFFSFLLDIVHQLTGKFYLMRWVPVLFGVLAVAMAFRLGKTLLEGRVALVAAFLLVITPIFIQYLREMRGYSATVFFGMAALFSLWQGIATGQKRYWVGLVVASVLGVYTHLYFTLALVSITLIIAGEELIARRTRPPQRAMLKPAIVSLGAIGFILIILYAPIVRQIVAVPEEQALRDPVFGPFVPTWDFLQSFVAIFRFFSPVEIFERRPDVFLGLVLVGCLGGLSRQASRRATIWLASWWLAPFWANLLVMAIARGSSAQVRFHLHTLPAYLLLGALGLFTLLDYPAGLIQKIRPAPQIRASQRLATYTVAATLIVALAVPETVRSLDEKTDEAWTAVAAYLRSEVSRGDIVLCEAFELHGGRGGNDGSCGWQLSDIDKLITPPLPNQSLDSVANFRGSEGLQKVLQQPGRVWFVIYFKGPPAYSQQVMDEKSNLAIKQFRSTWVVRVDSGQSLLENLINTGHWLLTYIPDEKHQFRYNLDLAQLYALAGDMGAANLYLEQAFHIQQASSDPDWAPEIAKLREVTAVVRFYAPVEPTPQHVVDVNFGNRLKLHGYSVEPDRLVQPAEVKLSFYWQTIGPLEKDYFVLVHLLDDAGNTVGYFDFQPFDAILPTSQWPVGIELREARRFSIPQELPPGDYTFVIGLYLPNSMGRLGVVNDASGENVVRLGTITIEGL